MKTLIIVRHSIAEFNSSDNSDFYRELTDEGKELANIKANELSNKIKSVDKIITSPANRAFTTAKYFATAFNYPINKIETDIEFYESGSKYITNIIAEQDNSLNTIIIVGHNPAITKVVKYYIGDGTTLYPCDVICIEFATDNWREIDFSNSYLLF